MNSTSKNIFHQILMEEFEKRKDKNQMDVVKAKRQQLSTLLDKSHSELRNKSYTPAAENYYSVIIFLKNQPYPDELQLSRETYFAIKCCFCYSSLMSSERFKDKDINSVLLEVIKELNDNFRTKLFPVFLLVLLNFHRQDWLATLTWCDEIAKFAEEEEVNRDSELLKELLPSRSQIRFEVETYEEIAFFGYGEKITRNTLLKPRLEMYKDWTYKLNDFIASKIVKLRCPISEIDLHRVFHQEIFPMWCLTNGKEYKSFYNDKFSTKCTQCMRAKLHNTDKYAEHCAQDYRKFALEFVFESDICNGKVRQPETSNIQAKKSISTPAKKQICSTLSQTEKVKTNHKYTQTESKSKNTEPQVISDPQVLSAILEIKNKCLTLQEKKDDIVTKLNKKINELHDRINKENCSRKAAENEFEKKSSNFKFEIQKLKEQLADSEKKLKAESEKNVSLQKLLMEQFNDKYNLHKQRYKMCEQQARFMAAYLNDLVTFLTPKSIPNDKTCRAHISIWENKLQSAQQGTADFNDFYQNIRVEMINSGIYKVLWPDLPELPKYEENLVFHSFKGAIKNIIQTEEQLYWKYSVDCQNQMQRPAMVNSINSFTYNMQRPQFAQQNNVYVGPRLVYSNTPAATVPLSYQTQQQVQAPKRYPPHPDMAPSAGTGIGANDPRISRSVEFLDRAVGGPVSSARVADQDNSAKGACMPTKREDKKETILLDYVIEQCPGTSEEEITLALLRLLEDNKGSLSEIPKERIVSEVKVILRMKKQAAWVTPKSPHVDWHNDHTENECSICFEEFSTFDKYTLDCQHEYHKECIKRWLRTSSVCPICRIHSVIDEEFPPLH